VPGFQLIGTRTVSKYNSSRHTINGKQSCYTTVHTLLKGLGIDLDYLQVPNSSLFHNPVVQIPFFPGQMWFDGADETQGHERAQKRVT